jgi:predicted Rossmann-fold nucleotide-binding protein
VRIHFGSARTEDPPYYLLAEKIALKLVKLVTVITGGGPELWKPVTKERWNFSGIEYCIAV